MQWTQTSPITKITYPYLNTETFARSFADADRVRYAGPISSELHNQRNIKILNAHFDSNGALHLNQLETADVRVIFPIVY